MKLKRVYLPAEETDGYRILVDRLWPRGISKEKAKIDLWLKEVAPSNELRKWFGHDPERFNEFTERYKEHPNATLLYAAHDEQHNNAVVLQELLETK